MKKLLLAIAILLGGVGAANAQSSTQGGGLSTKAIQALEECFDAFDNFTCGASSGSTVGVVNPPGGTGDTVAKWIDATTLGDSNITDDGTDITMPGTVTITEVGEPGIDLSDYGDASFTDDAIVIGQSGMIVWGSGTDGTFTYGIATGGGNANQVFGALSGGDPVKFHYGEPGGTVASIISQAPRRQVDNIITGSNVELEFSTQATTLRTVAAATINRFGWDGASSWTGIVGGNTSTITLICADTDGTLVDSDLTGVEHSLNLVGTATDFSCNTVGDSVSFIYVNELVDGATPAIFYETSRSVKSGQVLIPSGDAAEIGILIADGWGSEIGFEGSTARIEYATSGELRITDEGSSSILILTDSPNASGNFVESAVALNNMNGDDTVQVYVVNLINGNHTGVTNLLKGIAIDSITGDAQARETGIDIDSGFDVGLSSVAPIFDRQDFNEPIREVEEDYSAKVLTDAGVNLAIGHGGILFESREEQDKTTSSIIFTATGGLNISADNITDNEGVEIYLGSSQNTTTGYLVAQTDQLCFSANVTIALIAGTDQFVIGWRANAAYDGANVYTNYTDYAVVGINNVDGSVFGLSDSTTGSAETDDSTTNWADTETKTLKQCIDGAGLVHAYLDGTLVAETNRTTAIDSGIVMNPFVSYLQAGGVTDAGIVINWWEIAAN